MKITVDLDDTLYRNLKVQAARHGRTVRELVADGIRYVLAAPTSGPAAGTTEKAIAWIGSLREYAPNAKGKHDLASIRASVAKARRTPRKK